jgi:hypothetical protein
MIVDFCKSRKAAIIIALFDLFFVSLAIDVSNEIMNENICQIPAMAIEAWKAFHVLLKFLLSIPVMMLYFLSSALYFALVIFLIEYDGIYLWLPLFLLWAIIVFIRHGEPSYRENGTIIGFLNKLRMMLTALILFGILTSFHGEGLLSSIRYESVFTPNRFEKKNVNYWPLVYNNYPLHKYLPVGYGSADVDAFLASQCFIKLDGELLMEKSKSAKLYDIITPDLLPILSYEKGPFRIYKGTRTANWYACITMYKKDGGEAFYLLEIYRRNVIS